MGHSGREWAAIAIVLLYDWFSGFFLHLYFLVVAKVEVFFIGPESDHWECLSVTD